MVQVSVVAIIVAALAIVLMLAGFTLVRSGWQAPTPQPEDPILIVAVVEFEECECCHRLVPVARLSAGGFCLDPLECREAS